MHTFLKIAWRNIQRNFRRTLILALIISIGYVGMIFTLSFMQGYLQQAIENVVHSSTGHIQIHQEGFVDNPVIKKRIADPAAIDAVLKGETGIKAYSQRVKNQGMINSSESSTGVMVVGIMPEREAQVSNIKSSLVAGQYLASGDEHSIYLGKALAKKLKVGLNDKVVLMGQTIQTEVSGGAYRIKGLFQTNAPGFDKSMAFITLPAAQKLFEMDQAISEFVIIARDPRNLTALQGRISADLADLKTQDTASDLEILTWQEIMPLIANMLESSSALIYILLLIILIAICFSIVNTLFVVVFERFHEFGVMKAVGTRSRHIFMLVLLEALGMTAIGLLLGGILAAIVMSYFMIHGLDMTAYAKGLTIMNVGDIIYMSVTPQEVLSSLALTFFVVTLAALYPALHAARIKPLDALKFN